MGAPDLLQRLRGSGFALSLTDDGGVKVAPASALTDDYRQAIRANRAELVTLLRSGAARSTAPAARSTAPAESPRPYRLAKTDADRCHWPPWGEPEIQAFVARVALFIRRGVTATDADELAEALTLRDRDGDDRGLCIECRHLDRDGRCAMARAGQLHGVDRRFEPLRTVLQRCEGFTSC